MQETIAKLMQTELGESLSQEEATDLVTAMALRNIAATHYLFSAGDSGDALYVIVSGTLDVVLGDPAGRHTVVAQLGAGQVVGEMEIMTRSSRVASLRAADDVKVLEMSGDALRELLGLNDMGANKLVLNVARMLATRLEAVNQKIMAKTPPPPPGDTEEELVVIEDDDLDVLDGVWS